jgi:anti-anti-sigma factor
MLSIENNEEAYLVKLEGDVSIFIAEEIYSELTPLLEDSKNINFNLELVSRIDTSIIQILMFTKLHTGEDQHVSLVNQSDAVTDALKHLGFDAWFSDLECSSEKKYKIKGKPDDH